MSESSFGVEGEPVWRNGGGRPGLNADGERVTVPIPPEEGVHRYEWSYDERGLRAHERAYNIYGDLISVE
jgi:hypothetical protein